MLCFQVESWAAIAPGLSSRDDWQHWFQSPCTLDKVIEKIALPQIPPMQRRRFTALGKCVMGAVLPLLETDQAMPAVFASRHGDTRQTLSLLQELGQGEPLSPAAFSLSVHNAVSGLYSIVRKDISAVTAIAAAQGLLVNTLFEAVSQLAEHEQVLCVLYDAPLPELYERYVACDAFPYAVAFILSRNTGDPYQLTAVSSGAKASAELPQALGFVRTVLGLDDACYLEANQQCWRFNRRTR